MRKRGFTLIELLVVIAIIAMLMAILMPALSKVKKIAQRVVCGTNLKGLGTAQTVYANDYDDEYTVQGQKGIHDWDWGTGMYQAVGKNWSDSSSITIGASLYLLVREADVSPKSFVCPSGDEEEYDGFNTANLDIVELWDFGNGDIVPESGYAYEHVSYSYHLPYDVAAGGKSIYAATGTRSAAFAVMADKNPYLDPKLPEIGSPTAQTWEETVASMEAYYKENSSYSESSWEVQVANAEPHDRESQNVLYADGHTANAGTTDVGVQNDAIYLPYGGNMALDEDKRRRGYFGALSGAPVHELTEETQTQNRDDSFLVNDDVHDPTQHP